MADTTFAKHVFLPWVRQGAASNIQTLDSLSARQAGVVSVTVQLRINDSDSIDQRVRLYGPGDITGIDPQQVVRTVPRPFVADFEPNYFPAIEFDRPDFPWLFTPAKAEIAPPNTIPPNTASPNTGKLRPWLCLVVVQKQDGVTLRTERNQPLPLLEIKAPAKPEREMPNLAESWAWAHGQVNPPANTSLPSALAGDPALTLSRLICPRRLDPLTDYLACVVPTFELGRLAGLGSPITPANEQPAPVGLGLKPAWLPGDMQVTLPVYFHWEFRTGIGGDFEALVGLLEARQMPPEVGKRQMEISQPGFQITPALLSPTILELEGALRVSGTPTAAWPRGTQAPFQTALKAILNAPRQAMKDGIGADKEPLLAPPIYGSWQAAQPTVEIATPPLPAPLPPWLHELNLDPRQRVAAALGTQVVQAQQESLMAAAWEQLGEIERLNQMRRQAQLARAVNGVYYAKHFSRFSVETLLNVVAPGQSRLVVEATTTQLVPTRMLLSQRIAQSALPDRAVSAPLRRLTSARSKISTRFQAPGALPLAIMGRLNSAVFVPPERQTAGLVTINQVSDQATEGLKQRVRFENISRTLESGPRLGRFAFVAERDTNTLLSPLLPMLSASSPVGLPDNSDAQTFRRAAQEHQTYLVQRAFISFLTAPAPQMDLSDNIKTKLLQTLHPAKTITARLQASFSIASDTPQRSDTQPQEDPLDPILDAPNFPQPMYEALRDLSQDFLFPGLEYVPPNTVTLLETNAKFVESFLVGLNSEMSRELLWRGYPTGQRGTYFRQFWDTSVDSDAADIDRINLWGDKALGKNAREGGKLVLLLRGELLRRYPNSVIYAVRAVKINGKLDLSKQSIDESHPHFRGTLKPDVTFLGFNLTRDEALADPGWFFVIQEQPTEPHFGLDAADFDKPLPELTTWNDLNWRHLANSAEALKALSHVPLQPVPPDMARLSQTDKAKWGRNAAHQAYITLQRPVRIAIHAKDMIPK